MSNVEHWIYLSAHLDDAIYSCGGLMCAQRAKGHQVEVWTVFAGDAELEKLSRYANSLHARWMTPPGSAAHRREEDLEAASLLDVKPVHFQWPDVIYRKFRGSWLVTSDAALFDRMTRFESRLADEITETLRAALPANSQLVLPLGVGQHVDHRLVRTIGERLSSIPFYYADLPYGLKHRLGMEQLTDVMVRSVHSHISRKCIHQWAKAMLAYQSQFSTFWTSEDGMQQELEHYLGPARQVTLWWKP